MEKNTQKHIERENLLKYFVDSYESAYFVNLKDDTYDILHMSEAESTVFGKYGEGRGGMSKFIDQ